MLRILDIILSASALIILSPLALPIAIILKLSGEGEVFFRQDRIGLGGETFSLFKFATMLKDSPNMSSGTVTTKNDPRVLPVGHFLRKTKINELPQLLNVLLGDMSVIGPRPQTLRCFNAFPQDSQKEIVKVRPGLSGIGSIVFRGEEDMYDSADDTDRFYDEVIMPYKGLLEQWYVQKQGLSVYFSLIGLTVWVILFSRSQAYSNVFSDLPEVPDALREKL